MKKSVTLHADDPEDITFMNERMPTLCDYTLHKFFKFPNNTLSITITLNTKRTKNSYELKKSEIFNSVQIHYEGEWHYITMFVHAKKLIREFGSECGVKSLFVTLEY